MFGMVVKVVHCLESLFLRCGDRASVAMFSLTALLRLQMASLGLSSVKLTCCQEVSLETDGGYTFMVKSADI